jgi:hypothetical protein
MSLLGLFLSLDHDLLHGLLVLLYVLQMRLVFH